MDHQSPGRLFQLLCQFKLIVPFVLSTIPISFRRILHKNHKYQRVNDHIGVSVSPRENYIRFNRAKSCDLKIIFSPRMDKSFQQKKKGFKLIRLLCQCHYVFVLQMLHCTSKQSVGWLQNRKFVKLLLSSYVTILLVAK